MSKSQRHPVVLWQTGERAWSGRLLNDSATDGTASGVSSTEVVRHLKEYLTAVDRDGMLWLISPDFLEPTLRTVKVAAVPEYEFLVAGDERRKRTLPCEEPVQLRLPCVVGRRESGLICALLPTLDVQFELAGGDRIEEMALHYARQALKGQNPAALLRYLPPMDCRLEEIVYSPWQKKDSVRVEPPEHLGKVAEHVGSPAIRRHVRTWEREADVARVQARLDLSKGSTLLVGGPGSGKTAVLVDAARKVERELGLGPAEPRSQRFWISSGARLIAGQRWLGQWQEQLEKVIAELRSLDGVLCLESLQEMLRLGGSSPGSSLAAFLVPYLQTGELRVVVEATPEEVESCERELPAFLDALGVVRLEPLDEAQQARILDQAARSFSDQTQLDFTADAAREAGRLCRRFQPYAGFPGTPLGFMHEALNRAREARAPAVDLTSMRQLFATTTGLPDWLLDEKASLDAASLAQWFHERVVAQPRAVQSVCRPLTKFKAGLNDPQRPLAVLLFTGPTGTGKTQLAKTLGDYLYPNRKAADRMVRLDMSEYAGYDAARRLLGEAGGEPSDFIKRMRQNPFTVLLLDEVEKASPEVFDTLMNVFDEGRLTDTLGRTTWFRSTIIIMTSNLGARKGGSLGFTAGDAGSTARVDPTAAAQFFRPEFFNRLDEVVVFDPLDLGAVKDIARREATALEEREGLRDRGIKLQVSPALLDKVCEQGFDPVYGARPLQRRLEELVVTPVARWLVAHPMAKDVRLVADWKLGSDGGECPGTQVSEIEN